MAFKNQNRQKKRRTAWVLRDDVMKLNISVPIHAAYVYTNVELSR